MGIAHPLSFLVTLTLPFSSLAAQICAGSAPFSSGTVRVGAVASSLRVKGFDKTIAQDSYGAEIAAGSKGALFGSVSYMDTPLQEWNDVQMNAIAGTLGYQLSLGTERVQFCPFVGVGDRRGSRGSTVSRGGIDATQSWFRTGGTIGVSAPLSANLDLIPSIGGEFVNQIDRVTLGTGGGGASEFKHGIATVRLSLVALKRITVSPTLLIPFGFEDAQDVRTYALGISYNFGRR